MPEGVVRWQLEEVATGAMHTLELNPNEAESWLPPREISWAKRDSRMAGIAARQGPVNWSFSGVVRTEQHHNSLVAWEKKPGKIRITDHLGRVFEVMLQGLDMVDQRPTGANAWRFHYTFNALLLRRLA